MLLAALVFGAGFLVAAPLQLRLWVALVLVALYVPLAGAGPSIQRAGVMGAAGLVAALAGRPASRWYALALAAAVTLTLSPHAALEPGWQLSFAAVIALLGGARRLSAALTRRRIPVAVAEVTAITSLATIATAPLLAHHFGEVSVVSLPANLAAAPAVAPVMWLGMAAAALAQIDASPAVPLTAVNGWLVAYIEWVAHVAARAPMATATVELSWPAGVIGAYGAVAASSVAATSGARRLAGRWWRAGRSPMVMAAGAVPGRSPRRLLALAVLALGVCAAAIWLRGERLATTTEPRQGELIVSFLDVGQGDATLLQEAGLSVLVDTGPSDGPILERLGEAGVKRLDVLVLTHAQADHEGAALPVIRRLRPRLVWNGGEGWISPVQSQLADAARRSGGRVAAAHAGQNVKLGSLDMNALWPLRPPSGSGPTPSGDPNEHALVLHVTHGEFDLLLPADAESGVLSKLRLPAVEALKVSHHGSEDEGLPLVLERLRPRVAAIEVGRGNSYGHPAPSTVRALQDVAEVVRTDEDGTIRLRVHGGGMVLER